MPEDTGPIQLSLEVKIVSPFESELQAIINDYAAARERSKCSDLSDVLTQVTVKQMHVRCLAAIERATGRCSVYFDQATAILESRDFDLKSRNHDWRKLASLIGVTESLFQNIRAGYLKKLEELIRGDIFGDFLEMAQYLLDSGYKDAAAVVAGSTLESHLKQLCKKHGVAADVAGKPKKADTINADLVKAVAYSTLDQKSVTAWLGLRNSAAHGDYGDYDIGQVRLLISGVRDFITRISA